MHSTAWPPNEGLHQLNFRKSRRDPTTEFFHSTKNQDFIRLTIPHSNRMHIPEQAKPNPKQTGSKTLAPTRQTSHTRPKHHFQPSRIASTRTVFERTYPGNPLSASRRVAYPHLAGKSANAHLTAHHVVARCSEIGSKRSAGLHQGAKPTTPQTQRYKNSASFTIRLFT